MTARRRRGSMDGPVARMKALRGGGAEPEPEPTPKAKAPEPKRSKATFDLPPDLVAELRVASVLTGARNLSALAEGALRAEIERLRQEFHGGRPFPMPEKARAKRGRPKNA